MSAFFICLCPEFLGCLARFFAVPKTTEEIDREVLSSKSRGTTATVHGQQNLSHTMDETQPTSILFNCDMQGVEVILVEDSMQPDTSQALILSFNMKMTAEPGSTLQTMSGGIEKLAVFSSYFSLERRNEITYEVGVYESIMVLKSMDIGIDMKIDNETNATDIVLKMSPMEVRMSPSIIRLLSSVNSEFAKSSAVVRYNFSIYFNTVRLRLNMTNGCETIIL
uniref:Secreted protein n=1 Tax=Heterorhabditis bacteriophora TaxID=37862 RepID=A0A1I7W7K6_HETBA